MASGPCAVRAARAPAASGENCVRDGPLTDHSKSAM